MNKLNKQIRTLIKKEKLDNQNVFLPIMKALKKYHFFLDGHMLISSKNIVLIKEMKYYSSKQ